MQNKKRNSVYYFFNQNLQEILGPLPYILKISPGTTWSYKAMMCVLMSIYLTNKVTTIPTIITIANHGNYWQTSLPDTILKEFPSESMVLSNIHTMGRGDNFLEIYGHMQNLYKGDAISIGYRNPCIHPSIHVSIHVSVHEVHTRHLKAFQTMICLEVENNTMKRSPYPFLSFLIKIAFGLKRGIISYFLFN